ncbi:hypothetical protein Aph01nite_01350 [Acrocarpospora phusangensis]|uniref:C2H2-type domain-containing protein n=1 Tax=Acrocarpospora phusangensis TaxID=1070424 RepID=A0A919Q722_9ACTN|nr:hypothetical protein Aph01nite_01350 [Acrocarpospora phusangensis]
MTWEDGYALSLHYDKIRQLLDIVVRDNSRWLGVARCTRCGRLWGEDSITSGHADFHYVYPITATDAEAWLAAAEPLSLPHRRHL